MYQPHSTQHYHRNDEVNDKIKTTPEAKLYEHKQQLQEEEEEEYIINEEDDVIIDDDDDDYNNDYVDGNSITSNYNTKQQPKEMELPNVHQHYINHVDKEQVANKPMSYLPQEQSELLYNEEELQQMYLENEGEEIDEQQEEEIDEEGEIDDEEEEDEEDNIMQEEDDIPTYPLPPLPPIELPATIHGTSTQEMYNIISEIRRLIDDSVERERVKEMLLHDPHVLAGVAQVLHECGLLRRPVIQPMSHNIITHELLPLPLAPTPPLPVGYTS